MKKNVDFLILILNIQLSTNQKCKNHHHFYCCFVEISTWMLKWNQLMRQCCTMAQIKWMRCHYVSSEHNSRLITTCELCERIIFYAADSVEVFFKRLMLTIEYSFDYAVPTETCISCRKTIASNTNQSIPAYKYAMQSQIKRQHMNTVRTIITM